MEHCSDHECIRDKVNELTTNKRFWYRILDSKWFFWAATSLMLLMLGFAGWTIREIYAQRAEVQETKKAVETICQKTQETKDDVKDIKEEMKKDNEKQAEQRDKDQKELMKLLLDIQKQIKNK